jgi:3-deoxy-D-manno-octulosonic-acid transferase
MPEALARLGYALLLICLAPMFLLHLALRGRRQPEYLQHIGERFGRFAHVEPAPRIWVHAVSVGETRAAEPLLKALALRYPEAKFVITHTTPTGRAVALPSSIPAERIYLPYDYSFAVRRFLKAYRPLAGLLMETEVWPNLTREASALAIPLALINARLSARSLRRGLRFRALLAPALRRLALVLAQNPADATRLVELGARAPLAVGNLKFDSEVPGAQLALANTFRARFANRQVLLAASTREGEEELILKAWSARVLLPHALLVIVPRHPQRFDEVAHLIEAHQLSFARRSSGDLAIDPSCQVLLGDSMGEMLAYYASADVAYVGGGLLAYGTHNLIEACAVGCPVLLGPHTFNFADAARGALEAGAARSVRDADDLIRLAAEILGDHALREEMAQAALSFARAHQGATMRSVAALAEILDSVLQQHVDGH